MNFGNEKYSLLVTGWGLLTLLSYILRNTSLIFFIYNVTILQGLLETFVGLGLSAGPGIGGILFAVK